MPPLQDEPVILPLLLNELKLDEELLEEELIQRPETFRNDRSDYVLHASKSYPAIRFRDELQSCSD